MNLFEHIKRRKKSNYRLILTRLESYKMNISLNLNSFVGRGGANNQVVCYKLMLILTHESQLCMYYLVLLAVWPEGWGPKDSQHSL